MSKKKPLDALTKAKLLIQGEYLVISLVFLVVGILKICGILNSSEIRAHIFNIVTLCGATWIIFDFFWSTFSKKHREKVTYLDKCIMFPMGILVMGFDIYCLIKWNQFSPELYKYGVSSIFFALFALYCFQAIYHWFYPSKAVLACIEEEEVPDEIPPKEEIKDDK